MSLGCRNLLNKGPLLFQFFFKGSIIKKNVTMTVDSRISANIYWLIEKRIVFKNNEQMGKVSIFKV